MALTKIVSGQLPLTPEVAVQGPDVANMSGGLFVCFPAKNTSTYCWVGNNAKTSSSDVSSTDLFYLKDDGMLFFDEKRINNLNELWFMGATDCTTDNSDVVCWITG